MPIHWSSRQGIQTSSNNDAAAIANKAGTLVAMLVDGAEKGANGQGLARHWARQVVQHLCALPGRPSCTDALNTMRQVQGDLRHYFLNEVASYCLLILDLNRGSGQLLHTGDCLAVMERQHQAREWLNEPHTLDRQFKLDPLGSRHILTAALNARRFHDPSCKEIQLHPQHTLKLCTDGYWAEHLQDGATLSELVDDASALSVQLGEWRIDSESDCDNFMVLNNTIPNVTKLTPQRTTKESSCRS